VPHVLLYPPTDSPRDRVLRILISDDEHAILTAFARRRGRSMSEIVRSRVFTVDLAAQAVLGRYRHEAF
jgi:hypothetical protein